MTGTTENNSYTGERRQIAGRLASENAKTQEWWNARRPDLEMLWAAGKTAQEIADLIGEGISRNAVIGKVHRWGLAARPSPLLPKPPASPRVIIRPRHASRPQPVDEPFLDTAYTPERDRRANIRRAPEPPPVISVSPYRTCQSVEDPARYGIGIRYCGAATKPGKSYCEDHCERYYVAFRPRGGMFVLGPSADRPRMATE